MHYIEALLGSLLISANSPKECPGINLATSTNHWISSRRFSSSKFLISASIVWAQPAPIAKTGQTTSYATGDDGDLQNGVALPAWYPRFTDNGDGTVTDNLTGLMWAKNANMAGHHNESPPADTSFFYWLLMFRLLIIQGVFSLLPCHCILKPNRIPVWK